MRLLVPKRERRPSILDVSELLRPEESEQVEHKNKEDFRDFDDDSNPLVAKIKTTYKHMHTNQTVQFAKERREKWLRFDHLEATVLEALEMLNDLVDESDPDVDLPNIVHAFQTAERIRQVYPDEDWFHLTGLIHDMGKIMAFYDEPQWAVVGDTFPVGCQYQDSIVYKDWSFKDNPDLINPEYNTRLGIYTENCGLDHVTMSWGHDEYLYQVLLNHNATLPEQALYMIRYHSFYPWHTGEDYAYLCDEKDEKNLKWVKEFNKFDLYTKGTDIPDIESLKEYYQGLIDKYIPGIVKF